MPAVPVCYLCSSYFYIHYRCYFGHRCLLGGFQFVFQGELFSLYISVTNKNATSAQHAEKFRNSYVTLMSHHNTANPKKNQLLFNFRLLMYRHHILDVFGGIILGFFEALVMAVLWFGPETSKFLVSWISDEKIAGSDAEII